MNRLIAAVILIALALHGSPLEAKPAAKPTAKPAHVAQPTQVEVSKTWKKAINPNVAQIRVYDGDTIHYRDEGMRLYGINAPELNVACEKKLGIEARDFVRAQIASGKKVQIRRKKKPVKDKYGRTLIQLLAGGQDVAALEVANGLAVPYDGKGPRPSFCDD